MVTNTGAPYNLSFSEMLIFTNFKIDKCTDVRNTSDTGENSLREAINCANDGETVTIEYPVYNQTITLASPINIDKNLTINGFPSKKLALMVQHITVVFSVFLQAKQ